MGKSWTLKKRGKHDGGWGESSRRGGRPPHRERNRQYVPMEVAHSLWETRTSVAWPDANLPTGWHLKTRRVQVLPVPPLDLWQEPAYGMNSMM
jgi:hypothetical protein